MIKVNLPEIEIDRIIDPQLVNSDVLAKGLEIELKDYILSSLYRDECYYLMVKIEDRELYFKRAYSERVNNWVDLKHATRDENTQTIILKLSRISFMTLRQLSNRMTNTIINRAEVPNDDTV